MNDVLFTAIKLGELSLANRIVMAPMTRCRAGLDRCPTPLMTQYYQQRGTAGMIISEATAVSADAVGYHRTPGIYTDEQEQGWGEIADAVHAVGGTFVVQLWHCGRASHSDWLDGGQPVAPSPIPGVGQTWARSGLVPYQRPRELSIDDIRLIVRNFRSAAARARSAGADGVEVHGANGYLIDQFLRDGSNLRRDRYGGSPARRCRMPLEVVEAVCEEIGPARVGVRISPNSPFNSMQDSHPHLTFGTLAASLESFRLGYLHVIETGQGSSQQSTVTVADLRQVYDGAMVANGGYTGPRAREIIERGAVAAVSFGSPFIANPDLPLRITQGVPLTRVDKATLYDGEQRGYTDYQPATSS